MSERLVKSTRDEQLASAEIGHSCPVPEAATILGGTGDGEDVTDV